MQEMAIKIICECGKKFLADDEHAGRTVTCPECQVVLDLSQATLEPASPGDDWDEESSAEEGFDKSTSNVISEWASESSDFERSDLFETSDSPTDSSSFDDDAASPTMSIAERLFWSLVGVGGIVLVVLCVLGKFGFYGALLPHGLLIPGLTFAYRVNRFTQQRRTHAMRGVANRLKLRFVPDGDDELLRRVLASRLGRVGRAHRLTNLIHGTIDGVRVTLFDFEYREGKASTRQTIVRLSWRGAKLPAFTLGPRSWQTRDLFELVSGRDDITFASHATFSENYFLRGAKEGAIRKLFTSVVRSFYEQHPGLGTEVSGSNLLYYRAAVSINPDEIQPFLTEAFQLLALLRRANHQVSK